MDSILTIILIWVVISLLNYFSKKSKKTEKPKPISGTPPPVREKSEIPPFLREIFNIPQEKSEPIPDLPETETIESKESEYSIERDVPKTLKERKTTKGKKTLPAIKESIRQPIAAPITAGEDLEMARKYSKIDSMKDAVVWKEILDKPISMRPFRYRRRD